MRTWISQILIHCEKKKSKNKIYTWKNLNNNNKKEISLRRVKDSYAAIQSWGQVPAMGILLIKRNGQRSSRRTIFTLERTKNRTKLVLMISVAGDEVIPYRVPKSGKHFSSALGLWSIMNNNHLFPPYRSRTTIVWEDKAKKKKKKEPRDGNASNQAIPGSINGCGDAGLG